MTPAMTHSVEIYSPLTGAGYYRTAAMTEGKAAEIAAAYNEGLSEERKLLTAARVVLKAERVQGVPRQRVEREETRAGNRSWWD